MAASAATQAQLDTGTNIMIAGVSAQVAVTIPFLALFIDFHVRHYLRYRRRVAGTQDEIKGGREGEGKWTKQILLISLASVISTIMILTRCVYRVVEMVSFCVLVLSPPLLTSRCNFAGSRVARPPGYNRGLLRRLGRNRHRHCCGCES